MAIKNDIAIDCGADYQQVITLENDDGTPLPLAGYSARTQARASFDDDAALWDFHSNTGTVQLGNGVITFSVTPAITDLIQQQGIKAGVWDIELITPDGKVSRLVEGKVRFNYQVTRAS